MSAPEAPPSPSPAPESGDVVRRIERRAAIFTVVAMALAWVVPRGGASASLGVAGGALIAFGSFWLIRRGVDGIAERMVRGGPPAADATTGEPASGAKPARIPRGLGLFVLRYALLAGISYVMIARLRLPPIGLLCGASVTMLAAAAEVIRRRPS